MGHRVALIQYDIAWQDVKKNLATLERMMQSAEADTFVLSEMFQTGFATDPREVAESMSGCTLEWMRRMAQSKDAAIVGSVAIIDEAGAYRNRMLFVKPSGEVEYYDKRHLFSIGGEAQFFDRGASRRVVEWRGVRYLLQICYDLRFAVWSRQRGDYDVAIYSALWPAPRRDVWQLLLRARAVENQCYVVGVNRTGSEPQLSYAGDSALIDPYGRAVVELGEEERVEVVELDMSRLEAFRDKFPVGRDADNFVITE